MTAFSMRFSLWAVGAAVPGDSPSRRLAASAGRRPLLGLGCLLAAGLTLLAAAAGAGTLSGVGRDAASAATGTTKARGLAAYGKLPLAFVPNAGQLDRRVRYSAQVGGAGFFFTNREAVFSFARGKDKSLALRLGFVGANPDVVVTAQKPRAGRVNYLRGSDSAKWRTNVPTYGEVVYRDLWPGIDLVFRGAQGQLKYEFHVAPGASVDRVRLAYAGASGLSLDRSGNLRIRTSLGTINDSRPVSYQQLDGKQVPVASRFLLRRAEAAYGFAVGRYDQSRPLVIDPGLGYSTYLGGSAVDGASGIAVDGAGSAYLTGDTLSTDFPTSAGAFQTSNNGVADVFVTKLNAAGSALVYSTYLGGSLIDSGHGIAVDGAGGAYVTGYTESDDFPTTAGAFDTGFNLGGDAFVAKLNAAGSALEYSTYLGGIGEDRPGFAIGVDGAGSAYVTGWTESLDFPTSIGAFDTSFNGVFDAFVTKLNAAGSALSYSTYLGGSAEDDAYGIAVDGAGSAYVTGSTESGDPDYIEFPTTPGAFDTSFNGVNQDAFVTKLNAAGSALGYSTYLGGSSIRDDDGHGIAVDGAGSAYVTGSTDSTDFPTSEGAFDTSYNGGFGDAFVTKLNAAGSALGYSTYLGGTDSEAPEGIAVDGAGSAYVTGETRSSDFPTSFGAFDTSLDGSDDLFVTRLNAAGSALGYSTYLGGSGSDGGAGHGIAVDGAGSAYVMGTTDSADFPTTFGAFDTTYEAEGDVFVTKFDLATSPSRPPADFDGDGDTDISVWRPGNGTWYAFGGLTQQWGVSDDVPVPGQYDADVATDVAVWRPANGVWYVLGDFGGYQWGAPTDVPVPGDYDGDGETEFAVWRPATGVWYVDGDWGGVQWGQEGDVPVPADYDGDGDTDVAVWRPSSGVWYVLGDFGGYQWGQAGDVPAPGDYNTGAGAEFTVWRPSSGHWYVQGEWGGVQWGQDGDVPVPGDYDRDGDTEFAVWRPSSGVWYVLGGASQQWGDPSDKPLPPLPSVTRLLYP
jgi:hypothetical protein